jgi:hypothetical protein
MLKSDLKDVHDPKVLAKFPHLGRQELIREVEAQIREVEAQIADVGMKIPTAREK